MANLGKKFATVNKRAGCLTGWGAAFRSIDGDEVGIIAPNMRGLRLTWRRLSLAPLDETKVQRIVYFQAKALTRSTRRAKKKQSAVGKSSVTNEDTK